MKLSNYKFGVQARILERKLNNQKSKEFGRGINMSTTFWDVTLCGLGELTDVSEE
jgi:hypothetical protein